MPLQPVTMDMFIADNTIDALIALHNRSVDTLAGYHKMVEKAEPAFRSIPEEFRALHAIQAERIARMLAELGCQVEPNGTFMGTMNAVAVSVRAVFDQIGPGIVDTIRSHERANLEAFDRAIAADLSSANKTALLEMRGDLTKLLDRCCPLG